MNYQEALNRIHTYKPHGPRPGLERMAALMQRLGDPERDLPFLHIAGTNGKGSTATMLAAVLQEAGYKVGLFTSPFIYTFRERYRINGQLIGEQEFADLAEEVFAAVEALEKPFTEFELVTAIGFLYFKRNGCDVVVLEVGLGGRFDATNVIPAPLASVICTVSMDHTEFLGDTLTAIAGEKAGIIKKGCPTILYDAAAPEVKAVVEERCKELKAPLIHGCTEALTDIRCDEKGTRFLYYGISYQLGLKGEHQAHNAVTVLETLFYLREQGKLRFTEEQLRAGLQKAYIPARLEQLNQSPAIFADGGHNIEGIDSLCRAIGQMEALQRPVILFGMMKDKPYQYALQHLGLLAGAMIFPHQENPRAKNAQELCDIAGVYCDDTRVAESFTEAARLALKIADGRPILIAGSLYIIGDLAKELKKFI